MVAISCVLRLGQAQRKRNRQDQEYLRRISAGLVPVGILN